MYKKITESLYLLPGLFKNDAEARYEEMFGMIDHSKLTLEIAISKTLKEILGRGCNWQRMAKGIWTGNSTSSQVMRVTHKKKIYYLKLETRLTGQIGATLPGYHFTQKEKFFGVAKIVKQGSLKCCTDKRYYFQLMEEAPGKLFYTYFESKNYEAILRGVRVIGELSADFHNRGTFEMSSYERHYITKYNPGALLQKMADLPQRMNKKNLPKSFEKCIETMIPPLYECVSDYISSNQIKSTLVTWYKASNLTFDEKTEKIHFFDTSKFSRFCGPNTPPAWAAEYPLTVCFLQIRYTCQYFGISEEFITKCQKTLLNTYHKNLNKKVMSPEGIKLFLTEERITRIKSLIGNKNDSVNSLELVDKMMRDFTTFQREGDKTIEQILGKV